MLKTLCIKAMMFHLQKLNNAVHCSTGKNLGLVFSLLLILISICSNGLRGGFFIYTVVDMPRNVDHDI